MTSSTSSWAVWSGDGREIYFYSRDSSAMMAVNISVERDTLKIGTARKLFEVPSLSIAPGSFDVSKDGKRFALITNQDSSAPLTLVVNWPGELKR